jgi:general secretion pathway protein E/type IV pilus assembly protein PilB
MLIADDYVIQLAVEHGLLQPAHLSEAQRRTTHPVDPSATPLTVGEILVQEGWIDLRALAQLLAAEFGMEFAELNDIRVTGETLGLVPRALAVRHKIFPLEQNAEGTLKVAVADPLDIEALDSLAHFTGCRIDPAVAVESAIVAAIEQFYGPESGDEVLTEYSGGEGTGQEPAPEATAEAGEEGEGDAPIIKLVHATILDAIRRRASDIHIEPLEKKLRVRYRIDGVLLEVDSPPKRLQLAIISRLKIMANISIAEKRIPQDGRIQIHMGGRSLDLRVSSLPTAHGESIVMRILDKEGLRLGLVELGFMTDDQATFEKLIILPDGIVLVTGPTGSGKTTTLYSCLHFINKPDRKIITVEDPVEYQLSGINQVPVRTDVGMTFASALRAMLRQAPNIVMIGEIRDLETAEIAINASLTGHMVFSTLHTNDAPSAVTRLIDIGVKPFLVATSLRATMAQRLVRKICPDCRREYHPSAIELRSIGLTPAQATGATFARGEGCPSCHSTGYRGRFGIFEIFVVNEEIQHMIYGNVTAAALRQRARELGMRVMREDGIRKAVAGLTTIEEVVSTTVGDII